MPDFIKNRAKGGPIKWPALNLTLFSGTTLSVGAILILWGDLFKAFFGFNPQDQPGATAAIFVGIAMAIAVIFAADLIARGLASESPLGDSVVLPEGLKARLVQQGVDEDGYLAVSMRVATDGAEVLVLKDGKEPTWHRLGSENGQIKLLSA